MGKCDEWAEVSLIAHECNHSLVLADAVIWDNDWYVGIAGASNIEVGAFRVELYSLHQYQIAFRLKHTINVNMSAWQLPVTNHLACEAAGHTAQSSQGKFSRWLLIL